MANRSTPVAKIGEAELERILVSQPTDRGGNVTLRDVKKPSVKLKVCALAQNKSPAKAS